MDLKRTTEGSGTLKNPADIVDYMMCPKTEKIKGRHLFPPYINKEIYRNWGTSSPNVNVLGSLPVLSFAWSSPTRVPTIRNIPSKLLNARKKFFRNEAEGQGLYTKPLLSCGLS